MLEYSRVLTIPATWRISRFTTTTVTSKDPNKKTTTASNRLARPIASGTGDMDVLVPILKTEAGGSGAVIPVPVPVPDLSEVEDSQVTTGSSSDRSFWNLGDEVW